MYNNINNNIKTIILNHRFLYISMKFKIRSFTPSVLPLTSSIFRINSLFTALSIAAERVSLLIGGYFLIGESFRLEQVFKK